MRSLHFALIACCAAAPLAAQGNGFYDGRTVGTGSSSRRTPSAAAPSSKRRRSSPSRSLWSTRSVPALARCRDLLRDDEQHQPSPMASTAVSGLTDVQLRGAYTLGRDLAVLSLVVNLADRDQVRQRGRDHRGAAASNFLLFRSTATPTVSRSPAARASRRSWATGASGSLAASGGARSISPYTGSLSGLSYEPGFEGKIRLGATATWVRGGSGSASRTAPSVTTPTAPAAARTRSTPRAAASSRRGVQLARARVAR